MPKLRVRRLLFVVALVLLLQPASTILGHTIDAPSSAQVSGTSDLSVVGQVGGLTEAVAVQGSYAYVGAGANLELVNVSGARNWAPQKNGTAGLALTEVGTTASLNSAIRGITVAGGTAYVADGAGGMYIVDVSNPANPQVLGRYVPPGFAEKVAVSDHLAFLADGPAGLRIVDVSNPANPREVGSIYGLDYAFGVAVSGNYAYVAAGGSGILIANVADPTHPVEVGTLATSGYAHGVDVVGSTVYIADEWGGLVIADVSYPATPRTLGVAQSDGWAYQVVLSGKWAYVADTYAGLSAFDVSNSTAPKEMWSGPAVAPESWQANDLAITGGLVLVADLQNGLRVIDVSGSPSEGYQVGMFAGFGPAGDIFASGKYLYAVGGYGYGDLPLRVVDISNPHNPTLLPLKGPLASSLQDFKGVFVQGGLMYLLGWNGLYIYNDSNPLNPTLLSSAPVLGSPLNLIVSNGFAYSTAEWGFQIFNVSNPSKVTSLGNYDFSHGLGRAAQNQWTAGSAILGKLAYVGYGGTLFVIDISNPSNPTVVASTASSQDYTTAFIEGHYLYLIGGSIGIYDISNPESPSLVSEPMSVNCPIDDGANLVQSSNTLYGACEAGIMSIDVSNPAVPVVSGVTILPGGAHDVAIASGYIYASGDEDNLFVIDPAAMGSSTAPAVAPPLDSTPAGGASPPKLEVVEGGEPLPPSGTKTSPQPVPLILAGSGATLTVKSTADSGIGTLRWALQLAMAGDKIVFDQRVFPPSTPATIKIESQLPPIAQGGIWIDGGGAGVILNGSTSPQGTNGLVITSSNNKITGLQVFSFPGAGIGIAGGSYNVIGGNRSLGEGNTASANGFAGISIAGCIAGLTSDTGFQDCYGVTSYNSILGDNLGTDATGEATPKPQGTGIWFYGSTTEFNTVGGPSLDYRNVISGNTRSGVSVIQGGYNLIEGNYVGTDAKGTAPLGNGEAGIALEGSTCGNTVESNVASDSSNGIEVRDYGTSGNIIQGNLVGTDATGTKPLPDALRGIDIGASYNLVGGKSQLDRNIISGNPTDLVLVGFDLIAIGNYIGTNAAGTAVLGSSQGGVSIGTGATHDFIGGVSAGSANLIATGTIGVEIGNFTDSNFVIGNYVGINPERSQIFQGTSGVQLGYSQNDFVQANLIAGANRAGISVLAEADSNYVIANNVTLNSGKGISVSGSSNTFFSNSFAKNGVNGYDGGTGNHWSEDGLGNYWSNYSGTKGGNGIGGTPCPVPPNGWDDYPLMQPNRGLTVVWLNVESNIPGVAFSVDGTESNTGASGVSLPLGYFLIYNVTFPQSVLLSDGMTAKLASLNGAAGHSELVRLYENRTLQATYDVPGSTTITTTTTTSSTSTSSSSTSVTTTATVSSSSSTAASSSAESTSSSSSSVPTGGGGIPEFPFQMLVAAAFVAIIALTYLFARTRHRITG